jgi:hypothetical protein
VVDRASTFSDPEIVEILRTKFVPVAVDAWYMNRRQDAEGEFYRKVVTQEPSRKDMNSSTQGRYAFSADGRLLFFTNNRDLERLKRSLRKALQDQPPTEVSGLDASKKHPQLDRTLREGTVVVTVSSKVLEGYDAASNKWEALFQASMGEDHLWIRKDEVDALTKGSLPDGLKRRLARFHLTDNTRGEPPMWADREIRKLELSIGEGRLTGAVHLETDSGDRGYEVELLGFVESKDGKLSRFDVVAKGTFWGHGRYTANSAPKGKFPLAIAFRLADGSSEADRVPPQGSRDLQDYLK